MAEIIPFKHIPLIRCLMAIHSLNVRDCCGVMWLLDLVVGKRFDPVHCILPRAYLFGADVRGRFRIRGGITPHDPLERLAENRFRVGMAFQVTSGVDDILRLQVGQDGRVSNIRYLAFPQSITHRQVANDGFDIHLTTKGNTANHGN